MRRIILFFIGLLVGIYSFAGDGQMSKTIYYRHEVNVALGVYFYLKDQRKDYENHVKDILPVGREHDEGGVGPFNFDASSGIQISYYYHLNRIIALGGMFAFLSNDDNSLGEYEEISISEYDKQRQGYARTYDDIRNGKYIKWTSHDCHIKQKDLFVLPSAKFSWLNNSWCSLYSKLSLGVHYQHFGLSSDTLTEEQIEESKDSKVRFAYVILPIGLEIGKQKVRGFFELGFGSNTNLQIGLTYRFGRY